MVIINNQLELEMYYLKIFTILFYILITNQTMASDQLLNKIEFNMPEKFTDFSINANRSENDRNKLMNQLKDLINESISEYSKNTFEIMINDIDMAGRYIFTNTEFVRVVEDTDRTRFEFSYKMMDSNGKSIKNGDVNLTDRNPNNYKRQSNKYKKTHFSNEMRLFNDWLKSL